MESSGKTTPSTPLLIPKLTSSRLLEICRLPSSKSEDQPEEERVKRLQILSHWNNYDHSLLQKLLVTSKDPKTGCFPLHWAAGTGFYEAVEFILEKFRWDRPYEINNNNNHNSHGGNLYDDDNEGGGGEVEVDDDNDSPTKHRSCSLVSLANQHAEYPSTGRTPLHYSARNGRIDICRLLISCYGANPNPKCSRGKVTPLQLAVWQNQFEVVQYLISIVGIEIAIDERNDWNCGLMHWIGLIPSNRWNNVMAIDSNKNTTSSISSISSDVESGGQINTKESTKAYVDNKSGNAAEVVVHDDGSGVLPLAKYLFSIGISYSSNLSNCQNQGHTPFHKACWGGNLALLEYYRNVHGIFDTVQDSCGNYGADLAKMAGHHHIHIWLLQHCNGQRLESYRILLGLPSIEKDSSSLSRVLQAMETMTQEDVKRKYYELSRKYHPDKQQQQQQQQRSNQTRCKENENNFNSEERKDEDKEIMFTKIKEAYDHLVEQGGIGTQSNPKYEAVKLLMMKRMNDAIDDVEKKNENYDLLLENDNDGNNMLFQARILAIISDFGEKGCPIGTISKRWNQIWPDEPFPTPDQYLIETGGHGTGTGTGTSSNNDKNRRLYPKTGQMKRVKLLKFLKWKCKGVVQFREDPTNRRVVFAFPVTKKK